jgi:DNA-directed RNA polymerase specialized sigma24 family protein
VTTTSSPSREHRPEHRPGGRTIDLDEHLPAIAAGDPDAFGQWLAGAEAPLRRSLGRFATLVDVEAVLQETLLRMWQVAPRVVPDGRENCLLRLARVTARNLALHELRRPRAEAGPADPEESIEPAMPDPFLAAAIRKCRDALPPKPKHALAARLQAHGVRSDHELADRLGMKLNTFLQNFGRARRMLAECLERAGVELGVEMS